ncbi:MAG: hypothetical protein JWO89_2759 [Verrucomicrobiaceae bacterium]|nr:hypothetical protein [Verrucomicrobiaceae bacterium]
MISILRSLALLAMIPLIHAARAADASPFPVPPDIKGLQVQMADDALHLGIHHAGINVSLGGLMDPGKGPGNPRWTCEGEEFAFNAGYLRSLDAQVRPLSEAGVVVYAIILAYPTKDKMKDAVLLHPKARADGKYSIAAFNTATPEGLRWYRAVMEFLADHWSGREAEHGNVWGWIIGNEVNSHWMWYNIGSASLEEVASEHEKAVRIANEAVHRSLANARVYVSLDHHWRISMSGISAQEAVPGRDFLDAFARIARARGDFGWNLAHHPYPEDLGNPRVWADKSETFDDNTPKVTFKNLEVLCHHLAKPELLFEGKPRHIILSEQGFHTPATPNGEQVQAAAYAYAWEKCQRLPIDAFIYHRHVDHSQEGGLHLGLWRNRPGSIADPFEKKQIYGLFQKAGTPTWDEAAKGLLPVTGLKSWDEIIPRY